METLHFWSSLLLGLFLSGLCVGPTSALPPRQYSRHAMFQKPQFTQQSSTTSSEPEPPKAPKQVNTVSVACHPDLLEIVIRADIFAVGAPVNSYELRLGVDDNEYCRATVSSEDEYRIVAGLMDCGTKHWMTEDSLVYTNLLIYSPVASPNGVIRMDDAVIPIECHYERKYSLSSSSLTPTWIPFTATQDAVESLQFDLKLMTDDWLYERASNVYFLGDQINIEASVRLGHHMALRVFLSNCVATLSPDIHSEPKYTFIEDGCLVDSQITGSKSHFLARSRDDHLQMVIDAFRFHNDERGEIYITCHMNAVPMGDAEAQSKACTLVNGRWRSVDGNDYLCGYCRSQNEVGQMHGKLSSTGRSGPRGYGRPVDLQSSWRSGLDTNGWEQKATLGPMMVLPRSKSTPLPLAELPPVLQKLRQSAFYGSQWRSGKGKLEKTLPAPAATPDVDPTDDDDDLEDIAAETEDVPQENAAPEFKVKSLAVDLDDVTTAPSSDKAAEAPETEVEETQTNATVAQPDQRK